MRRYTLSEMLLRQLIREEVRGFSYAGIGIGASTEAQKTSYIGIAAKALGVTFAVAGALYIKDSWKNWTKKIKDVMKEANDIKDVLINAARTFENLPQTLSLQSLASNIPGTSTPSTPAPAAQQPGGSSQNEEYSRIRGTLIMEQATRGYRVIMTDYGELVDTNAIEILSNNVKAITGSGTKIIPQLKLDNLNLGNLDRALDSMLPQITGAISKINNLTDKNKNPKTLATQFGFTIQDSNNLQPVEGISDASLLGAQKRIANAFMYDAIAVLIYDKMCNEVLENIGRIASMKANISKSSGEEDTFNDKMEKFGESWISLLKSKLSDFAQKILSGEVFKE